MHALIKGTLMEIWKHPYMFVFIQKQYSENFAFLFLCEMFFSKHTETIEYDKN